MQATFYTQSHVTQASRIMRDDIIFDPHRGNLAITDVAVDGDDVLISYVRADGVSCEAFLRADSPTWIVGDVMPRDKAGEVAGTNNEITVSVCECGMRSCWECGIGCESRHAESFYVMTPNGLLPECVLVRDEARKAKGVGPLVYGPTFVPKALEHMEHQLFRMQAERNKVALRKAWMDGDAPTCDAASVIEVKPYVDEAAEFIKLAERKRERAAAPVMRPTARRIVSALDGMQAELARMRESLR